MKLFYESHVLFICSIVDRDVAFFLVAWNHKWCCWFPQGIGSQLSVMTMSSWGMGDLSRKPTIKQAKQIPSLISRASHSEDLAILQENLFGVVSSESFVRDVVSLMWSIHALLLPLPWERCKARVRMHVERRQDEVCAPKHYCDGSVSAIPSRNLTFWKTVFF